MRIVYDVRPLQTASRLRGIGTVTQRVLETLSTLDRQNEYELLRWPGEAPPLSLADGFAWRWLEVPRQRPAKLGWFFDRVGLGARLGGLADVAHFNSPFDLDMGWPCLGPVPPRRVVTLYDLIPVMHWRQTLRGKHRLLVPLFRLMALHLRQAGRVVSISETTARLAIDEIGLDPQVVRVAPIGVGEHFRTLDEGAREDFRARHGLREPYLLYVGGANLNKNLRRLLEAYGRVREIPNLVMLTRGLAPPADPRVRVLAPLGDDEVVALYNCARLVVMPSLFEGFGLPVLEAMACATPVACSDIAPFREVAGSAVRYFPPDDVASMATVLRDAWSDETWLAEAAGLGRSRAATFTWTRCAEVVLSTYLGA